MLGVWILFLLAPHTCWSLRLKLVPDANSPGFVLGGDFPVDFTPEAGDPQKINVWLFQTDTGTLTSIWDDIEPAKSIHSIFEIPSEIIPGPGYVFRATTTSNKLLADSAEFEIFATIADVPKSTSRTASSSRMSSKTSTGPTSTVPSPTTSTTPSPTTSAPNSAGTNDAAGLNPEDTNATSFAKKTPIGVIVGGVLGGLALLAVIIGFFCFRRRRNRVANRSTPGRNEEASPFTNARSNAASAKHSPLTESASPTSMSELVTSPTTPYPSGYTITASDSKRRISTRNRSVGPGTGDQPQHPHSDTGRAPNESTSSSAAIARSDDVDVRQELEALRTQVMQLEARQASTWAYGDFADEPPPDYPTAWGGGR